MAIFDVPPWASRATVTPTADEVWQVQGGRVRIMSAAPTSDLDGLALSNGDAINVKSGATITAWLVGPVGAQIVRF